MQIITFHIYDDDDDSEKYCLKDAGYCIRSHKVELSVCDDLCISEFFETVCAELALCAGYSQTVIDKYFKGDYE